MDSVCYPEIKRRRFHVVEKLKDDQQPKTLSFRTFPLTAVTNRQKQLTAAENQGLTLRIYARTIIEMH